jgi:hypothetical protein
LVSCSGRWCDKLHRVQGVPEICSARRCGARDHLDTEIRSTATTVDACALAYQRASNDACFATIMQRIVIVACRKPRWVQVIRLQVGYSSEYGSRQSSATEVPKVGGGDLPACWNLFSWRKQCRKSGPALLQLAVAQLLILQVLGKMVLQTILVSVRNRAAREGR